jgi:TPR repeat protein
VDFIIERAYVCGVKSNHKSVSFLFFRVDRKMEDNKYTEEVLRCIQQKMAELTESTAEAEKKAKVDASLRHIADKFKELEGKERAEALYQFGDEHRNRQDFIYEYCMLEAAKLGHTLAQRQVGLWFYYKDRKGADIPFLSDALYWLELAASAGDAHSVEMISDLAQWDEKRCMNILLELGKKGNGDAFYFLSFRIKEKVCYARAVLHCELPSLKEAADFYFKEALRLGSSLAQMEHAYKCDGLLKIELLRRASLNGNVVASIALQCTHQLK